MPRHGECHKTNPCFPKDSVDIVGHIMTEANFFTPSEARRVETVRRETEHSSRRRLQHALFGSRLLSEFQEKPQAA
jgi:hypothetical protein